MKAYLIDPIKQSVVQVEYNGGYETIYPLIGARIFDVARFNHHGDAVFVDDEGLLREDDFLPAFMIEGFPNPLVGKGLVLGCNSQGESTAPVCSLSWVSDNVTFCALVRDE